MEKISAKPLQRSLSRVLTAKWSAELAEILFLLFIGILAITLHAKLRIPMQIPGRQGLIFMALIVSGRILSHYRFAASLSCFGASSMLIIGSFGFGDPYMPLVYLILGLAMDGFFRLAEYVGQKVIFIALAGAFSWACIPLIRLVLGAITGFPYHSLMHGFLFPLSTHFLFGFAGSLIAAFVFAKSIRNN